MSTTLPADLPDDVRDIIAPHIKPDATQLDAIARVMSAKREEAKRARTESGIELTWQYAEEAYVGIDDANRHEFTADQRWAKPMSSDGPLTDNKTQRDNTKSTVFVGISARYTDAGSAKVAEILLPEDDKAFSFTETPVPELVDATDNESPVTLDHMPGNPPAMRPAKPGELANPTGQQAPVAMPAPAAGGAVLPAAGAVAPSVPIRVKDFAQEKIDQARSAAKKAETRIYDWMVECQYPGEARKILFDSARLGVGVLKGPFPKPKREIAYSREKRTIEIRETIKPAAKWVSPWDIFPLGACGENLQDGDGIFERDWLNERQVRELKGTPGYIVAQIDEVLKEGPNKVTVASNAKGDGQPTTTPGRFEIWYFTGTMSRADMECICQAAGKPLKATDVPAQSKDVFAIVTMINDRVVRATINPLDSGSVNYHSIPWRRRPGHWAGVGIPEQLRTPQRMVNAATRRMLENAGKSSGSQIVMDDTGIYPADGEWRVTPDKIWRYKPDNNMTVDQAFKVYTIPNVTPQLLTIIQYALKLAEESTNIPLVTQGQSGPTQPETLGGLQLQNNNANQLLRAIGKAYDDGVTEPFVRQMYEWLLLDPDVPDEEKGDFSINAHGSAAMVERAIQDQILGQLLPLSLNPAYKLDPERTAEQFLKSKYFDPRTFKYADGEEPPPQGPPPAVAVAQIGAQSREKVAQITTGAKQAGDQLDAHTRSDIATAQLHADVHAEHLAYQKALLDYANKRGISLDQVKSELAQTTMKLQTERELNAQNNGQPAPKPPRRQPEQKPFVQAPGRAANGHAVDQSTVQ